ncbi:glycosyltransferase family 4 protein [Spirosoma rhododendri]|uniref:Glycosyltransferase family 4 protein n=1 Tax=Spirosoma rhododendri TaxID=2728024 RepID=A0A7L5DU56_9BACT|nr:glycosyltransferase family 1 protein [Spirosoma rhododendri]QJD80128.1 glycosyltransferase family 4 protein [Spirosoma rhododendri]
MNITHYFRKPINSFHFSIERLFNDIEHSIADETNFHFDRKTVPHHCASEGAISKNIRWASKQTDEINHITGDIHYLALGLPGKNTILTIHDINFIKRRHPGYLLKYYSLWLLLPILRVKAVTVVSEETRKDVVKRVPFLAKKIRVIPNFYDPRYQPYPKPFNKQKPVLLQIGTRSNKNIENLIEAIAPLNCKLVIVGKQEAHLRALLTEKGIDYTWKEGLSDEEVLDEYRQCDITCFVSTVEGFGMPILESQAVGRAVVTSTTSSMPEVAGDAAVLVNPYDPASIRQGIESIIINDELREQLITNGFANIKRYELSHISAMYKALYEEVYQTANRA